MGNRKDEHVDLALEQRSGITRNDFDDVRFVHHALGGVDRGSVSTAVEVAGANWPVPFYLNGMTGGSERTGAINRDLAVAARETGIAMAAGSLSAYLKDAATAPSFRVIRDENPDGFVMANVNATVSSDDAQHAVDLLEADALQIHINSVQETVMPEGDRDFAAWPGAIEAIVQRVGVPVIVKEVGFGLSSKTLARLAELGVSYADVSGRGGTDFAKIENSRRRLGDYASLVGWGQSTPEALIEADASTSPTPVLLASGGVRTPLDVLRALALGARAVGVSGHFLEVLVEEGLETLVEHIRSWQDQLAALQTMLGAPTPAALRQQELILHGALLEFCASRGIDPAVVSRARGRGTLPSKGQR
ncbi:type 2 isopentenyl-diphosphate Delta-isomerase [Pseudoclavibacter terrae]|uniref:Isopentenyl-diphosphate delta-isomerase n=1 Tax=Pseudoclavibacter terrae TaxID=1530195 RepID=A0A7J5AZI4_9MICO|nr:type 2 isopentenyl-diphosphate Delta-isomerase [Pseudoclavibacter terrae]KAB1636504.1 type 2 isopentenyl-diphosphate Delta-isomerase [Pseudoclavibacter terrae]